MKAMCALITVVALFFTFSADAELSRGQQKLISSYAKTIEKSRKVFDRKDAAYELGKFKETPEVVEPLIKALSDSDALVRRQAADSLWRVGDVASSAEEALRGLLDDPSPGVQVRAAAALESLGVPEKDLVDARVSGLGAELLRDRILAVRDLVGFVPGEDLVGPINEAIAAMQADGTIEAMNVKWFLEYEMGQ